MAEKTFVQRLRQRQQAANSRLCIGLDPDVARIPVTLAGGRSAADRIVAFNRAIIDATADYACAFKLNLAFYEAHGSSGWTALERTVEMIPNDIISIADGKRGDIGNTARFYAESLYSALDFDAATVAPYMGSDAILPFLEYEDRAAIVLCRTSNPSADDLQLVATGSGPLYHRVAEWACQLNDANPGQVGLVVGATRPSDLREVRRIATDLPILIPGVGAQGGDPQETIQAASSSSGLMIINSSRSILYASEGPDFALAARRAAADLAAQLR
ncbi:MAG: orotidine-5'-phosphate decarboxylase [Bacteroidetes bacterium]|nr:orotidine-5'-phosphate decarboxylase [Bacteroidota bacterium]